jgi:hypothetical protein
VNTYDIGDVARLSNTFTTQATGAAVDPTTVDLKVQAPDGSTTSYSFAGATITKDSVGNYHVDIAPTLVGTYRYRWTSTGTGAASEEGSFAVRVRRVH